MPEIPRREGADLTILLTRVENPLQYGCRDHRARWTISRFLEEADLDEVFSDTVNTGIYLLGPRCWT